MMKLAIRSTENGYEGIFQDGEIPDPVHEIMVSGNSVVDCLEKMHVLMSKVKKYVDTRNR